LLIDSFFLADISDCQVGSSVIFEVLTRGLTVVFYCGWWVMFIFSYKGKNRMYGEVGGTSQIKIKEWDYLMMILIAIELKPKNNLLEGLFRNFSCLTCGRFGG
jgi:hypothetical protein